MKTRRITKAIIASLCFFVFMVLIVACNTENGMMHENMSTNMSSWNWGQIVISAGLGLILGFLLGLAVSRRK